MNLINDVRRRWSSGVLGKLMIGTVAVGACCILTFAAAALQPARPAQIRQTPTPGGSVFVAPTFPPPPTATPIPQPTAEPQPATAPTATPEPTATAGPTATTLSPEDAAKQAARDACGGRFRSASIAGGIMVVCQMADGFSDESIAIGAAKDYENIARAAWAASSSLTYVTLRLDANFKDKYGKVAEQPAFIFRMKAELYQKVNWDNFSTRNLVSLLGSEEELASVVVHPALRDAWRKAWTQ